MTDSVDITSKMGAHIKVRPRSSNYRAHGTERIGLSMRTESYMKSARGMGIL